MGLVHVRASIGAARNDLREMDFLIGTGSFYSAISPSIRNLLSLIPAIPTQVMLADGRVIDAELTLAVLKIDGREAGIPVEISEVPEPLPGVSALEALGMKVNPVTQQLEEVTPFSRPSRMTRFRIFRK